MTTRTLGHALFKAAHAGATITILATLMSGCNKRSFNSSSKGTGNQDPKCEIPLAIGPNVFDQNAELGDFPDKDAIVKTMDLPQSFRAELLNQFFSSLYWSNTVLQQQGGFTKEVAAAGSGTLVPPSTAVGDAPTTTLTQTPSSVPAAPTAPAGTTGDGGTGTALTLTGGADATKAPIILERIIVTKDASTKIDGSISLNVSGEAARKTRGAKGTMENGFTFDYVREPYFVFYKLTTNPNVPFSCGGKEHRFGSSKVFPGNVKAKVEVNRNITLTLAVTVGVDTALEMTGVPPPIADVLVKFLNVKGSVTGKFEVKDPIAHEMTYRGKTQSGLSKFEHSVAKNVVQPLCAFALAEIGETARKADCDSFLPGIPDPATDLQDLVNPKRKNTVYPVTSCSVAGRSGLFNLFALSVRVPKDYDPNSEQIASNQIRFNVFKREQANAKSNSGTAAWTNQNTWVTLKAVGADKNCLGKGGNPATHKCAVVELGQDIFGATLYPKWDCLCAQIGDGSAREVSKRCNLEASRKDLGIAANFAVSESNDRVAYPHAEPELREVPLPAGQAK